MSSPDDFGKDADSWWIDYFPDSEEIPLEDLCRALRTDPTFGAGRYENERDISTIIREVMGVTQRQNNAPKPPTLNSNKSQSSSLYIMYDPDEEEDVQTGSLVTRKAFVRFAKRLGPLKDIVKRSIRSFILHGHIVPWFHGCISRSVAESRLKRAMNHAAKKEGIFLVRTSSNRPENFVISVILKSPKTKKLAIRHQLIHNNGNEGFSTKVMNQPGNVTFPTLTEFLEQDRNMWRLSVTRDVFIYSNAAVTREREKHMYSHRKILNEQDAIVKSFLDYLKLIDTTQYDKTEDFTRLKEHVRKISGAMRNVGLGEISSDKESEKSLSNMFRCIKSRIEAQTRVVDEIEQIVVKKLKRNLMFEVMTQSQFKNLSVQIEYERALLTLLKRYKEILYGSSLLKPRPPPLPNNVGEVSRNEEKQDEEEKCSHAYLELWMPAREFHCGQCKIRITDPKRLEKEEVWIKNIHLKDSAFLIKKKRKSVHVKDEADTDAEETLASYHSVKMEKFDVDVNKSSDAAIMRGVTIEWLVNWTNERKCWNMPTWMVKMKFIVPETAAEDRCRYSELQSSRDSGAFGKADTFVSHCWVRKSLFSSFLTLFHVSETHKTQHMPHVHRVQSGDSW